MDKYDSLNTSRLEFREPIERLHDCLCEFLQWNPKNIRAILRESNAFQIKFDRFQNALSDRFFELLEFTIGTTSPKRESRMNDETR